MKSIIFVLYVVLWKILGAASVTTITTTPSSSTCLTTGVTNLLVEAKFEKQTTTQCTWIYGGPLDTSQFYISGIGGGCQADITSGGDTVTCAEETIDGIDHITTNLTIGGPLTAGTLTLAFDCISTTSTPIVTPSESRSVESCMVDNSTFPGVTATCSSACEYNVNATLSCSAGYEGSDVDTTCGADCTFADNATCEVITTTASSTTAEAPTTSPTDSSTDNNGSTSTTGSQTETSTTMGNDSNTDPSSRVASSETCLNGGEIAAIVICSLICVGCMVGFPVAFVVGSLTSSTIAIVGSTVGFLSGFVLVITFSALYDTNYICNDGFTEVISYLEVGGAIAMGVILAALTLAAFITEVLLYLGAGCFAGKVNRTETDSNVNRADTNLHVEQKGIEGKETTNSSYILSNNAKPPPYKKSHLAPLHNPPKPPRQPLEKGTPRPLPVPPKTSDPKTKSKEPLKKSSKNQITPRHDPTFNGDSNQASNSKANDKSKRNYEDSKTDPV